MGAYVLHAAADDDGSEGEGSIRCGEGGVGEREGDGDVAQGSGQVAIRRDLAGAERVGEAEGWRGSGHVRGSVRQSLGGVEEAQGQ